jgi:hypothetical protein
MVYLQLVLEVLSVVSALWRWLYSSWAKYNLCCFTSYISFFACNKDIVLYKTCTNLSKDKGDSFLQNFGSHLEDHILGLRNFTDHANQIYFITFFVAILIPLVVL